MPPEANGRVNTINLCGVRLAACQEEGLLLELGKAAAVLGIPKE